MKVHRTTRLFRGQLDLAPFLCVLFPLALVALFQNYLVLPRGARLTLPALGSGTTLAPGERALVVAVDASQRLYFENQVTTPDSLEPALARRVQSGGPRILLIQADTSVPYGRLAELAALARRAGIEEAIFGTLPTRKR